MNTQLFQPVTFSFKTIVFDKLFLKSSFVALQDALDASLIVLPHISEHAPPIPLYSSVFSWLESLQASSFVLPRSMPQTLA